MEQHPIPQQISSYQFKLVGDMTLKQFFQLAGGVLVSLLFYSSPLYPIIKWPLILFSVGIGAAMAFIPFEERPLEKWIVAFFKSIYSPTIFYWKKSNVKYDFFSSDGNLAPTTKAIPTTITEPNSKKLDDSEKNLLTKISALWSTSSSGIKATETQPLTINNNVPTTPITFTTTQTPAAAEILTESEKNPTAQNYSKEMISTPQQIPTIITRSTPKLVVEESNTKSSHVVSIVDIGNNMLSSDQISSSGVEFSIDAAPPNPPTVINTIVGQVIDEERKIIEGAIMEIKDTNKKPVRALKSNKAGHFIIVTPLSNGIYEISTEKDGFIFDPVSFEAKGDFIPPIAIKGKKI